MSRKGFTLIELLVVVAVLALLASIVFSNLGGAREGARISNALAFQSQTHSLLGSDLVGWWNFNDPDARYKDTSGYDNHGSCTSCPTATDGVPGIRGDSLSFDGVNNFVTIPSFPIVGDFTYSAWVYPHVTSRNFVTNLNHSINNGTGMGLVNGRRLNIQVGTGTARTRYNMSNDHAFSPEEWVHLLITYSNGSYKGYINGIDTGYSQTVTPLQGLTPFVMGRDYTGYNGQYFNGLIDDVRIYSRALSASEIQTLYAQTKDKYLAEND